MSKFSEIREAAEQLETITMTTDELLQNLRDAMRWRDECGDSSVEIFCEFYALRLWEALDARLSSGDPIPADWLMFRPGHLDDGRAMAIADRVVRR